MGLFSRKTKNAGSVAITTTTTTTTQSTASINSTLSKNMADRTSASSITLGTPLSPAFPVKLPKVDLPRPPDPQLDPAGYLRSLGAIRERSSIVFDKALQNQLHHFDVDLTRFPDVVSFVAGLIKRDYEAPFHGIPPHGRCQHFCIGGQDRVADLLAGWPDTIDNTERCRRLIDLFLVSVLLDAGSGTQWSYKSLENGRTYRRSEGLAIASFEMFKAGLFSSDPDNPNQVDKIGLCTLTVDKLRDGLQSRPDNALAGLKGRTDLLRLAEALDRAKDYFGFAGRPGHMIDHLLSHPSTKASSILIVPLPVLWNVLINGLATIWPASRTALNGISLGDAWPCQAMPHSDEASWESILPFHKLTQWLTYSLMQPMQSLLNMHFAGTELLTGLPEYRNGGLFIDMGVLTLRPADCDRGLQNFAHHCKRKGIRPIEVAPMFEPGDVVEWRGVTIGLLDKLCVEVNDALKKETAGAEITLPQLLEAGSWKGGREIAEIHRPNTKEPPILIESDGTVF